MQCPSSEEPMTPGTVAAPLSLWSLLMPWRRRLSHLYFRAASPCAGKERILGNGIWHQACRCRLCGTVILIPGNR